MKWEKSHIDRQERVSGNNKHITGNPNKFLVPVSFVCLSSTKGWLYLLYMPVGMFNYSLEYE
jgi:hypothetical protein